MPSKYYISMEAWQTRPSASPANLNVSLKNLSSMLNTYHAQLRTIRFRYLNSWKLEASVGVEEAGIKREHVKLYDPAGGGGVRFYLAEPGKNIYFNPGNHQSAYEISVVTAKAIAIPGWASLVVYAEIIAARADGTFTVMYGLRSKHPLYDHVHTFTSTQDEIPLVVSEPTQTDPTIGFLTFMGAWWGFKTKADALAILKTPAHKTCRTAVQSVSFT